MAKPGVKPMLEAERLQIRSKFVAAAQELLAEDGLESLNTKKIGLRAGYSHTNIYNYFGDFNELLCLAVEQTAWDCERYVRQGLSGDLPGGFPGLVERFAGLMIEYNTRNLNLYYPFLSTRLDFSYFQNRDGHPFVHPAYALFLGRLKDPAGGCGGTEEEVRVFADILTYIFHSKLHFFIRYGVPATVDRLQAEIGEEIRFLLARAPAGGSVA